MAAEHYNRIVRLLEKNIPVRLRLDVQTNIVDNNGLRRRSSMSLVMS